MKVKLVILFSLTLFLLFQIVHKSKPTTIFKSGVKIGDINLSNKTWDEGKELIDANFSKTVYLNIDNTSRAVTLREIGIGIDTDVLSRYTKTCRLRNPNLFCKITSNEPIDPSRLIKRDTQKINEYLDALEEDFQFTAKNTVISFDDYSFRKLSPRARIVIDRSLLLDAEKTTELISKDRIKIGLKTIAEDDKEDQHKQTKDLIQTITKPLLIKYGKTPVYIPSDEVAGFFTTEERNEYLYGTVSKIMVLSYLKEIEPKYESTDVTIIEDEAVNAIRRALLYRAADPTTNLAVILPIEGNPKSDGSLHDVYLEVLKSQQRLYKFEGGKLTKTYVVSTGLTWDTPAGEYSILGKQKMTISYFGNWYMPDYLPVGTINGNYRFGFHAIPYHMDAEGNIYSRDINTMGSPATGGCIQLKPAEATELFEWAKVGIPVYIYN